MARLSAFLPRRPSCGAVGLGSRGVPLHTVRDWFWLYLADAPSTRAPVVQVLRSAHAMAGLGHRVTLCVRGDQPAPAVLEAHGLAPLDGLSLQVLPPARTWAAIAYRLSFLRFCARTGGRGVGLARQKRHADQALRACRARFRLILEVHEVDSAVEPEAEAWHALERRVLAGAHGVIVNAPGTLTMLRARHPVLPPALVVHNAADPGPPVDPNARGVGVVGSFRLTKDPWTVAEAARQLGPGVLTWVGVQEGREALVARSEGNLRVESPIPQRDVPGRLARFRVLLLPLSRGLFGESLTSPLKLWDALQSGVVLVAADTAAVRLAAPGCFVPYEPGDASSLVGALRAATDDLALRARVLDAAQARARSWSLRAGEIAAFADRVLE